MTKNDKYVLVEHPNGHYWKIIDSRTGEEYSKKSAVDLMNSLDKRVNDTGDGYGLFDIGEGYLQLCSDGVLVDGAIFDSKITAKIIVRMLNGLHMEREYYRSFALRYLLDYDLYSDEFLETLESIYGKDKVDRLRKNQSMIMDALERENLL